MSKPKLFSTPGFKLFADGVIFRNSVIFYGLSLGPIVAIATTLKASVAFSAIITAIMLPICLVLSLVGKKIPDWILPVVYTLLAAFLLVPATFIGEKIMPSIHQRLGIFLPLIAVNTMVSGRARVFASHNRPGYAVLDAFARCLGFSIIMCLVGAIREIMVSCTIYDVPVSWNLSFPVMDSLFGGLIIVALLAALLQKIKSAALKSNHNKQ